jgi:hypothetical protein
MQTFGPGIVGKKRKKIYKLTWFGSIRIDAGVSNPLEACADVCLAVVNAGCRGVTYKATALKCIFFKTPYIYAGMLKKTSAATSFLHDRHTAKHRTHELFQHYLQTPGFQSCQLVAQQQATLN